MEPCAQCDKPTDLYYKGTPIYLECEKKFFGRTDRSDKKLQVNPLARKPEPPSSGDANA